MSQFAELQRDIGVNVYSKSAAEIVQEFLNEKCGYMTADTEFQDAYEYFFKGEAITDGSSYVLTIKVPHIYHGQKGSILFKVNFFKIDQETLKAYADALCALGSKTVQCVYATDRRGRLAWHMITGRGVVCLSNLKGTSFY